MQPPKTNKTLYGLMAFLPLGLSIVGVILMFPILMMAEPGSRAISEETAIVSIFAIVGLIMIAAVLSVMSLIMYIIHIGKNPRVPQDQRILWILGMVFVNGIVQIVYYFVYIAKEDEIDRQNEANMQQFGGGNAQNPWN